MHMRIERRVANEYEDFGENLGWEDRDRSQLVPRLFQGPNLELDVTDILVDRLTGSTCRFIALIRNFKRAFRDDCVLVVVSDNSVG
jgi:hypothetical protein